MKSKPQGFEYQRGIGARNPAVERREASVPISADGASLSVWNARRLVESAFTRVFYALWRLRAGVIGPRKGASQALERLSALRPLIVMRGNKQSSEG